MFIGSWGEDMDVFAFGVEDFQPPTKGTSLSHPMKPRLVASCGGADLEAGSTVKPALAPFSPLRCDGTGQGRGPCRGDSGVLRVGGLAAGGKWTHPRDGGRKGISEFSGCWRGFDCCLSWINRAIFKEDEVGPCVQLCMMANRE